MTRIEVGRVDPAEALRRIRARLVEALHRDEQWGDGLDDGLYNALRVLDEEWPNAAVTE